MSPTKALLGKLLRAWNCRLTKIAVDLGRIRSRDQEGTKTGTGEVLEGLRRSIDIRKVMILKRVDIKKVLILKIVDLKDSLILQIVWY